MARAQRVLLLSLALLAIVAALPTEEPSSQQPAEASSEMVGHGRSLNHLVTSRWIGELVDAYLFAAQNALLRIFTLLIGFEDCEGVNLNKCYLSWWNPSMRAENKMSGLYGGYLVLTETELLGRNLAETEFDLKPTGTGFPFFIEFKDRKAMLSMYLAAADPEKCTDIQGFCALETPITVDAEMFEAAKKVKPRNRPGGLLPAVGGDCDLRGGFGVKRCNFTEGENIGLPISALAYAPRDSTELTKFLLAEFDFAEVGTMCYNTVPMWNGKFEDKLVADMKGIKVQLCLDKLMDVEM